MKEICGSSAWLNMDERTGGVFGPKEVQIKGCHWDRDQLFTVLRRFKNARDSYKDVRLKRIYYLYNSSAILYSEIESIKK